MMLSKLKATLSLSGGILLVSFGIILPTLLSIKAIREDIDAAQIAMDQQYRQQQALRDLAANLQATREITSEVNSYAIREGEELRFIQALESVAEDIGLVQTINLDTANQQTVSDWEKSIPLTVTLRGPFPDILRYLRNTEALPYRISIHDIRISEAQTSSVAPGTVDVRMVGRIHWLANSSPAFVWEN